MGTINPPIPRLNTQGQQPAQDIVDALEMIRDELNGNIQATNIRDGGIADRPSAIPAWKEVRSAPEAILYGGVAIPGLPPEYIAGPLTLSGSWPAPAPEGVLREGALILRWSKGPKFNLSGAVENDPNTRLFIECSNTSDPNWPYVLGINVPGSDGLRTRHQAIASWFPPMEGPGPPYVLTMGGPGGQLVSPWIGNRVQATVSSPTGFFGGTFTIHEFIYRYRDWEF